MPTRLKRACAQQGCPELTDNRYCEQHQKQRMREYNRQRGSSTKQGYNSRWRRLRLTVLKEEPLCRECTMQGLVTAASQVDHIDGNVHNLSRDNLQPLCAPCHSRKTALENGRWGGGRKTSKNGA